MRSNRGFTLVELIVVIVVIGILATLATLGLSKYLQDGRDTRRAANVAAVAEALEKYYDKNGEYPSCGAVTTDGDTVTSNTLKGLDKAALVAPGATGSVDNSYKCGVPITVNGEDFFEYVGDGSPDCTGAGSCLSYTIKYKSEAKNAIEEVESRRQTDFATSGTPTLTLNDAGVVDVDLSWTLVPNASSYRVQRATNSSFTTGVSEQTFTSSPASFGGLSTTTHYYFRVVAVGGGTSSQWSNTVDATTLSIGTPTFKKCTINSASQITVEWNAASAAESYTLQRATNNTFTTSLVTTSGIAGTSQVVSGLTTGTVYYFRVQAVAGPASGAYSAVFSCGAAALPTGITAAAEGCGGVKLNWTAGAGAASYRIEHSTSSSFTSPTSIPGVTGTTYTVTGFTDTNMRYFRMYSVVGSAVSAATTAVSAAPSVCPPAAYTISCTTNSSSITCTSNAICLAGATAEYAWYANSGLWVQGTTRKTVTYTPGYDQHVSLTVNTRCGGSSWVGGSNNGGYARGIPAPGAPTWIQHVVSNDLNMRWYAPGCAAGTQVSRVQIVRRSNGVLTQDSGDLWNATSWRRGSLPVASWNSYVFSRCQGTYSTSGWGPSALGLAG